MRRVFSYIPINSNLNNIFLPYISDYRCYIIVIILFYFEAPTRLSKPVLDLDLATIYPSKRFNRVCALPGGEAVVNNFTNSRHPQVLRINSQGQVVKMLYDCAGCTPINGLIRLGGDLFVIQQNGTVIQINLNNTSQTNMYHIPGVSELLHLGSLYYDPDLIPDKDLLLPDYGNGQILSYRLSTREKTVHVRKLKNPISVTYSFYNNSTFYVICEYTGHQIGVYDSKWNLVRTFGRKGTGDGELDYPQAAIMTPEGTVIVADGDNNRVSEFSMEGRFLKHIITGLNYPSSLSMYPPYLWVVRSHNYIYRYKMYEST